MRIEDRIVDLKKAIWTKDHEGEAIGMDEIQAKVTKHLIDALQCKDFYTLPKEIILDIIDLFYAMNKKKFPITIESESLNKPQFAAHIIKCFFTNKKPNLIYFIFQEFFVEIFTSRELMDLMTELNKNNKLTFCMKLNKQCRFIIMCIQQLLNGELKPQGNNYDRSLKEVVKRKILNLEQNISNIIEYCEEGKIEDVKREIEERNISPNIVLLDTFPLLAAIEYGHLNIVEYLLSKGADPNKTEPKLQTALQEAIVQKNLEIIKVLVQNNADVNSYHLETTPLLLAIEQNSFDIVQFLVENGADINAHDNMNFTGIMYACINKNVQIAEYLLSKNCRVDQKNKSGETVLLIACKSEFFNLVKPLVERVCNVNEPDLSKITPLYYAILGKSLETVKFLIEQGEKIDEIGFGVIRPIQCAIQMECMDILDYLVQKGSNVNCIPEEPLPPLSYCGMLPDETGIKFAQYLIKHGADIKQKDKEPLFFAILKKKINLIKFMVNEGADLQKRDDRSPLFLAARKDYLDAIKVFLENGADINLVDVNNQNILYHCLWSKGTKVLEYLCSQGIDVNQKFEKGLTPLHIAAYNGSVDAIKILLEHGAQLEIQSDSGDTPLNYGFYGFHSINALRYLIEHGADVNSKTYDNTYILHKAVIIDSEEIIKLLIDHGAKTDCLNKSQMTPLQRAIRCKKYNSFKALIKYGGDIQNTDPEGYTTLHSGVILLPPNLLAYLISKYIKSSYDINPRVYLDGATPLHIAVQMKKTEAVHLLVDAGANLIAKDNSDHIPLYYAMKDEIQNEEIILTLIKKMRRSDVEEVQQKIYREELEEQWRNEFLNQYKEKLERENDFQQQTENSQIDEGKIDDSDEDNSSDQNLLELNDGQKDEQIENEVKLKDGIKSDYNYIAFVIFFALLCIIFPIIYRKY